jgi:hypothetical protein
MPVEVAFLGKGLAADLAGERFDVLVDAHVDLEGVLPC